jgi:DNA-directed RNA polymerase II subunit RPB4
MIINVSGALFYLGYRVYNKTLEYVKTFAKFNTTDSASAVRECVYFSEFPSVIHFVSFHRTLRREPALTQFETAQIANLCPADAEEAKSIIPRCVFVSIEALINHPMRCSLVKIEDDRLQALLDEIQTMRKFQS